MSSKYGQSFLTAQQQSGTDAPKTTSKRANQKVAYATGELAEYRIAEKIMRASSKSTCEEQVNSSCK